MEGFQSFVFRFFTDKIFIDLQIMISSSDDKFYELFLGFFKIFEALCQVCHQLLKKRLIFCDLFCKLSLIVA